LALTLFAAGILAALAAPAVATAPFKSYQLLVFCGNSQVASATFWQDVKEESMGLKSICVGTCPAGTVPLADVLAGLPAEVSAGLRAQVEKREADAAAGKGRSLAACLNLKPPAEDKCDSEKACEAVRAIESLIARYNGPAGSYFGSFAEFNREFSQLLQKLSEALACRFNKGSDPPNASALKNLVGQILHDKNGFLSLNERSQFPQKDSCIDRSLGQSVRPSLVNACADFDTMQRISTNLSRLGGALGCPGISPPGPSPKTDCKQLSNGLLDGLTTLFKQMDQLQAGNQPPSSDSYDLVADGIESALDQLQDAAGDIEGTGGTGAQQYKDIQGEISKLRKLLDVWGKMKSASCLPPEVEQLLRQLARQKRAGTEYEATCTELCAATADWYVEISGLAPQRGTFFKACSLACF
jgi:hypothetical protein